MIFLKHKPIREIIKLFYLAFIKKKYFPNTYIVKYILGLENRCRKIT